MLLLLITKTYAPDDKEFAGEEVNISLKDVENGKVIMEGDYYHNKIESKIEGFFRCLNYLTINYEVNTVQVNSDEY